MVNTWHLVTRPAKKQGIQLIIRIKKFIHRNEPKKKMTQMMEFVEKDIKTAIAIWYISKG